jgi:hypothetical protein
LQRSILYTLIYNGMCAQFSILDLIIKIEIRRRILI